MWKEHENTIETAMKFTERWKNMKEEDIKEEDIKKTFYIPASQNEGICLEYQAGERYSDDTPWFHQVPQAADANILCSHGPAYRRSEMLGGEASIIKWFKHDHVTAKRQVGSTIKPLIYSLAVQDAGYDATTEIPGGPVMYGGVMRTFSGGVAPGGQLPAFSKIPLPWGRQIWWGWKGNREFAEFMRGKGQAPPYFAGAGAAEIPMLEML